MTKYKIEYTTKFKKQFKKLLTNKKYKESDFKKVVEMLANDEALPEKYHNHLLEPKSIRTMGMSHKTRLVIDV